MTEEVKTEEQAPESEVQEPKEEPKKEAPAEAEATKESKEETPANTKNKKINKLSLEELNAKIEDYEKNNMKNSNYYNHLILRKKELEPTT